MAGRLWITLSITPSLHTVIFISLELIRSTRLASSLHQTLVCGKLSPQATDTCHVGI